MIPVFIGDFAITVALILSVTFLVSYHVLSHGRWRYSDMGRHVFGFVGALLIIMVLAVLHWIFSWNGASFAWCRAVSYMFLTVAIGWRVYLLFKIHREESHGAS